MEETFDRQQNSRAIDALRGYAILLVIGLHVIGHVPTLVWPAKRFLLLGYSGVQLFFIASAVTLLMSWSRSKESSLSTRITRFFKNRFFRIAPLYFLAIPFYWVFEGLTGVDFKLDRLLATLLFVNAWTPDLLPTTGGWKPVPGGWSISVEFMFYLLFPLLALWVTTVRRALLFVVIAYAIMLLAAVIGASAYSNIDSSAREYFLFFWPPNHLIVFAIGFLLYRCLKWDVVATWIKFSRIDATTATIFFAAILLLIQFYSVEKFPRLAFYLPQHFLLTICFAIWALFIVLKPTTLAASDVAVYIGKMSFSIYLVHFAVLACVNFILTNIWPFGNAGFSSIGYACSLFFFGTVISYYLARITYRFVEAPFIQFGKRRFLYFSAT